MKKVLPSQKKYNESHPTVSVRVSRELYDKLSELRRVSGKSLGDVLREAVGKQVPSTKQAYLTGYNAAKSKYQVAYRCCVCGKTIIVNTENERNAIARFMGQTWHCGECKLE